MRARLSYPYVASTLALAVAIGGGGAAIAANVGRDSVGSPQIIDDSIKPRDLRPRAVPTSITVSSPSTRGAVPLFDPENDDRRVSSVSFDAPRRGTAVITVEAELDAMEGTNYIVGDVDINGRDYRRRGFDWDAGDVDGWSDQRQTASFVVPIRAGRRKVTVSLIESTTGPAASQYYDLTTSVQYISGQTGVVEPESAASRGTQGDGPNGPISR